MHSNIGEYTPWTETLSREQAYVQRKGDTANSLIKNKEVKEIIYINNHICFVINFCHSSRVTMLWQPTRSGGGRWVHLEENDLHSGLK